MPANNEDVNSSKQTLFKLLATAHQECLPVELARERVASIHRTAEKGGVLGNPHSPGPIAPGPREPPKLWRMHLVNGLHYGGSKTAPVLILGLHASPLKWQAFAGLLHCAGGWDSNPHEVALTGF